MRVTFFSKITMAGVVASVMLFMFAAREVTAYPDWAGERKEKWEALMREVHEALGLEPVQAEALGHHCESHRAKGKELHAQIREKREELRQAFEAETYDEANIRRIHEELKELRDTQEDHRLEGMLEVRRILTQDQFIKFMALKHEKMRQNCEIKEDASVAHQAVQEIPAGRQEDQASPGEVIEAQAPVSNK